jgi:mannitol/fructose-specific phosphotransferase system IIA component (Ntr-type)
MISILDMLQPERILMDLPATGKTEVLRAMVDRLAALGHVNDPDEVHRLLVERERLMTTGVKRGFAFPHAFSKQFDTTFLTLGIPPGGVEYQSLGGQPVEFIFLLLGPPTHQTLHLRMLARISRLTSQGEMLDLLRQAAASTGGAAEIMDLLINSEARLKPYPYSN